MLERFLMIKGFSRNYQLYTFMLYVKLVAFL